MTPQVIISLALAAACAGFAIYFLFFLSRPRLGWIGDVQLAGYVLIILCCWNLLRAYLAWQNTRRDHKSNVR